ncbi:MAG: putative Co/Zn/Cd efflux system rane fusion protein [Myxococcales bacterium]|nr:putative Co/Zn/Cd efflux system rane fusion protein [Myxococcales bacterium]
MAAEETQPGSVASVRELPPARHRRRLLIWTVVIVLVVVVMWRLRSQKRAVTPPRAMAAPVSVVTATATRSDMHVYLDSIGTVTPVYTVSIASQVTGRVMAVKYREGQLVQKGTPLVEIDPRPFQATLQQAEGTLERDTQVLAQAVMDRDRFRIAWAKRAIAKQQLDDQEKLVLQTEGTVKFDRGTVEFDKVQLAYCHIRAPITGRIGLRLVDPGNLVNANAGTVLAVITQLQPITVVFTLSEDSLSEVLEHTREGTQLPVDAFDRVKSRRLASGKLITIDNQIDTTTGTVKLRAVFDNKDAALFPNQFVNTKLLVSTVKQATVVPSSAIQRNGTATFVYVIQAERAHVRHVKTAVTDGDLTQVEGIAPGTVVANSSFEKLQDGSRIQLAPNNPPPSAANAQSSIP